MDIERINGVLVTAINQCHAEEIDALHEMQKHTHAKQVKQAIKLDAVDPLIAKSIVTSGLKDGDIKDDKVGASKGMWPAASLRPSQTSMVLDKALGMALFMLKTGQVGGDLGALVATEDGQIMDGHHRWAATIFASGKKGKVGGFGVKLKGPQLLRLLNILTKGAFGIKKGKPGKGSISQFKPDIVKKKLTQMTQKGISGDHPWKASQVRKVLEDKFGSVEKGIETISARTKLIPKKPPSWAPDRKQMPVIDDDNIAKSARILNKGTMDWRRPFATR